MKFHKISALVLLLLVLLAGCKNQEVVKDDVIDITIIGGSPAGVYFMVANGISECINASYPGSIALITPGASSANPIRIGNHDGDVGLMSNNGVISAKNGTPPYDEKIDNLAAIARFYQSNFQIVVTKDLGISSLDEIIENKLKVRLSIGQSGSDSNYIFERILDEYGTTIEEMEAWGAKIFRKKNEESSSMLSSGTIDGYSLTNFVPSPPIIESSLNKDLILLEMDPNVLQNVSERYGYSAYTIPGDSYDFHPSDYATLAMNTLLCSSTELDDETAYKIARSLAENVESMRNVHSALKDMTPESLSETYGVDLHPGALKYYREIGVIK